MGSSPLLLSFIVLTTPLFSLSSSHSSLDNTNNLVEEPVPPVVVQRKLSTSAGNAGVASEAVRPPNTGKYGSRKLPTSSGNAGVASEPVRPPATRKYSSKPGKVDLSLYYEAMCPFCRNFIVSSLASAVNSDLMDIVNLELVPWGNAHLQPSNNTIVCQHGEDECYLNIIHACAINLWPDVRRHFSFVLCVEQNSGSQAGSQAVWAACAQQLGLPKQDIQQCYNSGRGKELELQYGRKTENLKPPHEYVPWVVVNGTPLRLDYGNFVQYVCRAYNGKIKPRACTSLPNPTTTNQEEAPPNSICHKV